MKGIETFSAHQHCRGRQKTSRHPSLRSAIPALLVAAILTAAGNLVSCVPLTIPTAGQPVLLQPGQALVFGRIRMFESMQEKIEYSPFWFDPIDQPPIAPGPRMTLEIRQLQPQGGAFNYKTFPNPAIDKDGTFYWILPAGDYRLAGNPRLLGSKKFAQGETVTLARFSVPESGGVTYLGTLIITIDYTVQNMIRAWKSGEAEYIIATLNVIDDAEQATAKLRERFPAFPGPVIIEHMVAE